MRLKKRPATIETNDRKQLLIFEAARLCYDFDLSQREVAETLGLSPATLTRLLKRAKDLGIIKITVQPPDGYAKDVEIVSALAREKLGLRELIVTPSSTRPETVRKEVGFAAAQWLLRNVVFGMRIGFSGGRTVAAVVPFLRRTEARLRIVQLVGGAQAAEEEVQADAVARAAALQMGERCEAIHGPAIFPDAAALESFSENRIVAQAIAGFDRLDVAVVGVGSALSDNPLSQAGALGEEELASLAANGCVGDICCRFFDGSGGECSGALAGRILAIRLEQIARVPKVCAVATGVEKVPGIAAAARAGLIKTLVTDLRTVEEIAGSDPGVSL